MAQRLESDELVSFKELLMANTLQVDTAIQLLIEKGFFTEAEYFNKLKLVQAQYEAKKQRLRRSYLGGRLVPIGLRLMLL